MMPIALDFKWKRIKIPFSLSGLFSVVYTVKAKCALCV